MKKMTPEEAGVGALPPNIGGEIVHPDSYEDSMKQFDRFMKFLGRRVVYVTGGNPDFEGWNLDSDNVFINIDVPNVLNLDNMFRLGFHETLHAIKRDEGGEGKEAENWGNLRRAIIDNDSRGYYRAKRAYMREYDTQIARLDAALKKAKTPEDIKFYED